MITKMIEITSNGKTSNFDELLLRKQARVIARLLHNQTVGKLYKLGFKADDIQQLEGLWNGLQWMLDQSPEPVQQPLTCPQCGSTDAFFYDGALGYEAIRCNACNEETDCNNGNPHSQRTDRTK